MDNADSDSDLESFSESSESSEVEEEVRVYDNNLSSIDLEANKKKRLMRDDIPFAKKRGVRGK